MARFETYTVGSQVIVLPKGLKFEYPAEPEANYIDTLVAAKLKKLRIAPSELCTDETFLRRVYLDIVGLPPTVEEYDRFMASTDPDKRAKLIDELLERKEFSEIWVNKWAELLQVQSSNDGQLQGDVPVLQLARREALEEHADGPDGPGAARRQRRHVQEPGDELLPDDDRDPGLTENVAQVFMGMRIQCAQCHNHPFDRWTQNDYYGFAAFFCADRPQAGRGLPRDDRLQLGRRRGERTRSAAGSMTPEVPRRRRAPTSPARTAASSWPKWLASPENPWFAASFANRVWAHFMGMGIVEPVDDFRVSNPASNPELLDALGKRFTDVEVRPQGPGPRHLQLADVPAVDPAEREQRERRAELRPRQPSAGSRPRTCSTRSALVTDTKDKFQGLPLGARAVQIADGATSDLLPDHLRPRHPRDGLLVRGQDGADPLAGPPPAQRRHRQRQDRKGKVVAKLLAGDGQPEERIIEPLCPLPLPQADARRGSSKLLPSSARGGPRPRPSRTSSGPC